MRCSNFVRYSTSSPAVMPSSARKPRSAALWLIQRANEQRLYLPLNRIGGQHERQNAPRSARGARPPAKTVRYAGRAHEEVHHRRARKPSPAHQGGMRIARGEDGRLPAPDARKPLPAEITQCLQAADQSIFRNAIDRPIVKGRISAAPRFIQWTIWGLRRECCDLGHRLDNRKIVKS